MLTYSHLVIQNAIVYIFSSALTFTFKMILCPLSTIATAPRHQAIFERSPVILFFAWLAISRYMNFELLSLGSGKLTCCFLFFLC
jgi:hypothetical protein